MKQDYKIENKEKIIYIAFTKLLLLITLFGFFFLNGKDSVQNRKAKPLENNLNLDGLDSYVSTIEIAANGDVYAGGYFRTAGGVPVNAIAKWDGNNWSALGGQGK